MMVFLSPETIYESVKNYNLRFHVATYCTKILEDLKKEKSMAGEQDAFHLEPELEVIADLVSTAIWSFHLMSKAIEHYESDELEIKFMLNHLADPKYQKEVFLYLENMYKSELLECMLPSH